MVEIFKRTTDGNRLTRCCLSEVNSLIYFRVKVHPKCPLWMYPIEVIIRDVHGLFVGVGFELIREFEFEAGFTPALGGYLDDFRFILKGDRISLSKFGRQYVLRRDGYGDDRVTLPYDKLRPFKGFGEQWVMVNCHLDPVEGFGFKVVRIGRGSTETGPFFKTIDSLLSFYEAE